MLTKLKDIIRSSCIDIFLKSQQINKSRSNVKKKRHEIIFQNQLCLLFISKTKIR